METSTLNIAGTPSLLMFLFVHPWVSFFAFCVLVVAIFGTITDMLVAWSERK